MSTTTTHTKQQGAPKTERLKPAGTSQQESPMTAQPQAEHEWHCQQQHGHAPARQREPVSANRQWSAIGHSADPIERFECVEGWTGNARRAR